MKPFKWNSTPTEVWVWDSIQNIEIKQLRESDLNVIKNPNFLKIEDVLRSLCKVVTELAEIEERRL